MSAEQQRSIPGYDYGSEELAASPVTLEDLDLLKQAVLFTDEDERYLRMAGDVLESRTDQVLEVWYGFVGSHPHLLHYFTDTTTGEPEAEYLARVRERFAQWILDTCRRPYDQQWLDYQHEIALRHTDKKNRTDGALGTPPLVPLRYLIAFVHPLTATLKPFLAAEGHPEEEFEKMHGAWFKAVTLQAALWSQPYAREGRF